MYSMFCGVFALMLASLAVRVLNGVFVGECIFSGELARYLDGELLRGEDLRSPAIKGESRSIVCCQSALLYTLYC